MNGLFRKICATLVKDKHSAITVDSKPKNLAAQGSNSISKIVVVIATSLGVTALITGARHLTWLQPLELAAYDQMLRSRPVNKIDNRLLIVAVDEEDKQSFGYPLPVTTINKLLKKLESYQPRVIGLNIYRASEKGIGTGLVNKSKLIGACKFSSPKNPEIAPPLDFPPDNIGFNDLVPDQNDRTVRRALLFGDSHDKKCNAQYSFAASVITAYLNKQGIKSTFNQDGNWVLGSKVIPSLKGKPGSYEDVDLGGYQIFLNYRHPDYLAQQLTLRQVFNNQINPDLVKDKLVIIGNTASSIDRGISTPYGALPNQSLGTPGVLIQAQVVSNILGTVLDDKPFIWYWSDFAEIGWVWLWALVGGVVGWRFRNPLMFLVVGGTSLGALLGICYFLFLQAGWVPVVPPAIALLMTGIGTVAYLAYRTEIETRIIIIQVEKQQEAIAQLSALLKEPTRLPDTQLRGNVVDAPPQRNTGDYLLSGRYEITRVLGSGGFGSTYVAKDTQRPGEPSCVVKQLMPARRDARFMEVARRLFDAEAEILLILGKHIQIPDLLAYFEENNEFYLVEEYVRGQTLSKELSARDTQDEEYVTEMLKSVLQVLKFVHEHRVIHRDIKPDNIIRNSQDNNLVLIDFGAVKKMQPPSNETELATVAIGTRGYAAPEQLAGHPRLSSDIYALGMIGIQALTGVAPQALDINPDTGNVEWRHLVTVSDKLGNILDKMVCYHFNERYQTAAEVLDDLT
ncbi:serine/threonine protein kinase [Dulcicalothrix desertica PCC 7102]|uniref:non-specific serine/threonine protein kinase n=1 Tax=Dulcicalothrix desertica PCC 7102 TaxID=232991 RepID=A0A3S1CQI7_9CYAN|nr:CHASE2 domain-containing serine/threonine-protein kinase [Dulcicalothrix desertica]RUT08509.1 serine/threonine protein kinase [Dulcicalothrix desertica PCC 7102]TWH40367.1 CHASE2 domain-containing sensor protein [Dulcicalothrix desertica PCC 7102]